MFISTARMTASWLQGSTILLHIISFVPVKALKKQVTARLPGIAMDPTYSRQQIKLSNPFLQVIMQAALIRSRCIFLKRRSPLLKRQQDYHVHHSPFIIQQQAVIQE